MAELPPWSYSMLEMFEQCPKKAFHKYLLKEKAPETEAQRLGNVMDKALEKRLKDRVPLPAELGHAEQFAASFDRMHTGGVKLMTQLKMGLKRDFTPCGFFDQGVWGRTALDIAVVGYPWAVIADWKNGTNNENKPWYDGGLQRKLYALFMFKAFPRVDKVTAFNIWLKDQKMGKPLVYTRQDQATLWKEVLPKVLKLEAAFQKQDWPPLKGPLCGWCPVVTCNFHPEKKQ